MAGVRGVVLDGAFYICYFGHIIRKTYVDTKITLTLRAVTNRLPTFSEEVSKTGSRSKVVTEDSLIRIDRLGDGWHDGLNYRFIVFVLNLYFMGQWIKRMRMHISLSSLGANTSLTQGDESMCYSNGGMGII